MITDPLFYAVAIPAVTLLGLAKGGFAGVGMISTPMVSLVVGPIQAASIMLPILIVQDAVSVYTYWGKWDRRNLALMLPGAMLGILLAWLLAARVSEAAFELALGLISLLFGLRYLVGRKLVRPSRPGPIAGAVCGLASGFTSTIAHAGAPPFQIYVMPQRLPHEVFAATSVLFFAVINVVKVAPFAALGGFSAENLATAAALLPLAILTTLGGVALVRRISGERFYSVIYGLLVLAGLQLTWNGGSSLF
jgi:uncharacterized membrane protein YfcA